jgi:membrane-associated protease RseP (regulator of RpoE activity)
MSSEAEEPTGASRWRTNLILFVATVASVFVTGATTLGGDDSADASLGFLAALAHAFTKRDSLVAGAQFAGTLLTILVAHELGHYIAARIHKVEASLPFFIPMPLLSPFGTMGAIIRMRGTIPTRRALLDIGAAGPLAGLVFAIPLYAWGTAHSHLVPASGDAVQLGESILLKALDRAFGPNVPDGMDILLSPVAFGAWGGMFVTMINLLPVGQLDGGHVAYALFGTKQDKYAPLVHRSLLAFFFVVLLGHVGRDVQAGVGLHFLGRHLSNALFWLFWFEVLAILGTLSSRGKDERPRSASGEISVRTRLFAIFALLGLSAFARASQSRLVAGVFFAALALLLAMEAKGGVLRRHDLLDHPPTGAKPLDRGRAGVAVFTLVMFVLLFMPEPFSM